jgi:HAD superfamily hydrolase (TIGR01549 family)
MIFDHFFWDFDGTLFDSYPCVTRAFLKGLNDLGISAGERELLALEKIHLGHAAEVLGRQHGISPDRIMERFRAHETEEGPAGMAPYPGTKETLKTVAEGGGHNYLYTHRGISAAEILDYHGLSRYFTDIVTALDGFPAKPAPDALLHLMAKHGLNPARCVMLGDREIDVRAGLNAGMHDALMDPDGYCLMDAEYVFRDMASLRQALAAPGARG